MRLRTPEQAMSRLQKIVRLQFGLRTLLALVVVAAIASAYVADLVGTSRAQREFLELAKAAELSVEVNAQDFESSSTKVQFGMFDQITSVQFTDTWRRNLVGEPQPLAHAMPGGGPEPDFDALIELITSSIAPSTWNDRDSTKSVARQKCLQRLGDLPYLRSLNLRFLLLTDEELLPVRRLQRLAFLDLGNTQLNDAGMAHLAGLRELRRLSVGRSNVTDAGLKHLAALENLELLDAGSTALADGASPHLNALKRLRWLYLDDTKITSLQLRGLHDLEYLTLHGTPIRELTLEACPSLGWLDLEGTNVSEQSLFAIGKLAGLVQLDLGDTRVTAQGLAHLRNLPNLRRLCLDVGEFDAEIALQLQALNGLDLLILNDGIGIEDEDEARRLKWKEALKGIEVQWNRGLSVRSPNSGGLFGGGGFG